MGQQWENLVEKLGTDSAGYHASRSVYEMDEQNLIGHLGVDQNLPTGESLNLYILYYIAPHNDVAILAAVAHSVFLTYSTGPTYTCLPLSRKYTSDSVRTPQ
jgi:hypothetical protein